MAESDGDHIRLSRAAVDGFQTYYELTRRLFSSPDLKRTLHAIVESAVDILDADYAGIVLAAEDGSIAEEVEDLACDIPLKARIRNSGVTREILDTAKPVFVPDTWSHPQTNPILRQSGVRSYVGMPLLINGTTKGILYVYSQREHAFDDQYTALATFANLTALAITNAELMRNLSEQAMRDGLTNLYNYRYLHERLNEEIERSKRLGQPVSLIYLDMDDFKKLNDTYGHLNGDRALRHFADIARSCVRACDVVARTGGDEFVILLPGADSDQARRVGDRVRRALSENPPLIESGPKRGRRKILTVSMGIACYPIDASGERELMRLADERLFEHKRAKLPENEFQTYSATAAGEAVDDLTAWE